MILPAVFGLLLILAVLWEAFETVVLPRRVTRRLRITVLFYRGTWPPWRALARSFRNAKRRESFLGYYGPLSLLFLFIFWAALLILGFGLVIYSVSAPDSTHPNFDTCFYLSGTTFFTLGLGDVTPHTRLERILAVIEKLASYTCTETVNRQEFAQTVQSQFERFGRYLAHLNDVGVLQCPDPDLAARQFIGLLSEALFWPRVMGRADHVAAPQGTVVEEAVRMFLLRYRAVDD